LSGVESLAVEREVLHPNVGTLSCHNLVKKYGQRTVVNEISVDVNQGEVVGILGPNGAGKTTTFYMLVGIVRPNDGNVTLGDVDITKKAMYERARYGLGYLPQEASIFRKLTVEDNLHAVLEFTKMSKKERNERVEELLTEFRLIDRRKVHGGLLSGGERRRVEIARTLASRPAYILLDEPFTGIDPIAVDEIQEIVLTLKNKGIGVLITDHNVRETLSITDRSYIVFEGKVLTTGTSEEILNDEFARKHYLGQDFNF